MHNHMQFSDRNTTHMQRRNCHGHRAGFRCPRVCAMKGCVDWNRRGWLPSSLAWQSSKSKVDMVDHMILHRNEASQVAFESIRSIQVAPRLVPCHSLVCWYAALCLWQVLASGCIFIGYCMSQFTRLALGLRTAASSVPQYLEASRSAYAERPVAVDYEQCMEYRHFMPLFERWAERIDQISFSDRAT
jgi:hypothetical protein